MNLSPDIIARLLRGEQWVDPGYGSDPNAFQYLPLYGSYGTGSGDAGNGIDQNQGMGPITGFDRISRGGDGRDFAGQTFDTQGNLTDSRQWRQASAGSDIAKGIATLAAAYMGTDALFGPGGLATTGGSAAGGFSPLDIGGGPDWGSLLSGGGGAGGATADLSIDILGAADDAAFSGGGGGAAGQGMDSATRALLNSAEGYGAGMTGSQTGMFDMVNGLTGSSALGSAAAGTNANGLLSTLGSGIGQMGSAASSLLGGAGNVAALLGGAAGAQSTPGQTTTRQASLDPRFDASVFGSGGLLSSAGEFLQNNRSGMNEAMRSANARQQQLMSSPLLWGNLAQQNAAARRLLGG